ncbi:MAG: Purine nucleoside phosphoramidase [Candidatus Dichloromethanomonas elyunquensis]|nr:MAG: Purine nucleoside phosphoramidase [Candidatus Dichloromethanomonas elyunquensis]
MSDCIFCKIIRKEIPAQMIYEDEELVAFKDIHPVAPVHVLVIPKKHMVSVNDLTDGDAKTMGSIFIVIKKLASELGIAESGFRVVANSGEDGGQEVGHLHFHLLGGKPLGKKIG